MKFYFCNLIIIMRTIIREPALSNKNLIKWKLKNLKFKNGAPHKSSRGVRQYLKISF